MGESRIETEFFQGHTEPVSQPLIVYELKAVQVLFVGSRLADDLVPLIISLDTAGLILQWRYEPEAFTGFGSFGPSTKTRLHMKEALRGGPAALTKAVLGAGSAKLFLCLLEGASEDNKEVTALAAISLEHPDAPLRHKVELKTFPGEPLQLNTTVFHGADLGLLGGFSMGVEVYAAETCVKLHTIKPPWLSGPAVSLDGIKSVSIAASANGTIALATNKTDQVGTSNR